jgi:Zn-dependent protease with chaperone function
MNNLNLFATKCWIRLYGDKFVGVSKVSLLTGESYEVVLFSNKYWHNPLGQTLPWGTIIIHEFVIENEKLLNYVIVHELAHTKQWFRLVLYPTAFSLILFLLLTPISLAWLVQGIFSLHGDEVISGIIVLILAVIFFIIPMISSWFIEYLADCKAFRSLGYEYVVSGLSEASQLALQKGYKESTNVAKAIFRYTHPPRGLSYKVCKHFHKDIY